MAVKARTVSRGSVFEARTHYLHCIADRAKDLFISPLASCASTSSSSNPAASSSSSSSRDTSAGVPMMNVSGVILAGLADLKNELKNSSFMDKRLKVLAVVDISSGGNSGFQEAIVKAAPFLKGVRLEEEIAVLNTFMTQIATEAGKVAIGISETSHALELGVVDTVIVWQDLQLLRTTVRFARHSNEEEEEENGDGGLVVVVYHDKKTSVHEAVMKKYYNSKENRPFEVVQSVQVVDWFLDENNTVGSGIKTEFVSDASQEGAQFCKGLGGIGALLRYPIDFSAMQQQQQQVDDNNNGDDDYDYDSLLSQYE